MIDTRPLWVRALTKRGVVMPPSPGLRSFMVLTERLSGPQFLNAVRVAMGLHPMRSLRDPGAAPARARTQLGPS